MSSGFGQQWQSFPAADSKDASYGQVQGRHASSSSSPHEDPDESHNSADLSTRRDPPRKRNRAALSCVACRERKIKCNRQIPCDQCTKRGDQDMCFLDPYKRGPPAGQSKSATVQAQLQAQAEQQAQRDAKKRQQQATQHYQQQHHHPHDQSPYHHSPPLQGRPPQLPHPVQQQPPTMPSFPGATLPPMMAPAPYHHPQPQPKSTTHSDAEVETIKARLAQLEAVLANGGYPGLSPQGRPMLSPDSSNASIHNGSSPGLPSMSTVLAGHSNQPSRRNTGNHPQEANQFATGSQQDYQFSHHRQAGAVPGSPAASTPGHKSNTEESVASPGHADPHRMSNVKTDSDTEDAAMVLEGLAMSGQGSRKGGKGGGSYQSATDPSSDVVAKEPKESLMGYVARNRETDIMLDISQGGTSGPTADEVVASADCKGRARSGTCAQKAQDCRTYDELVELQKTGVDVSPADMICKLLKTSGSLFRPVFGPESLLGYGMGWAFPAAEAAEDLHVKGGECPGSAQREAVLRAIIRTLPRKEIADQLVSVYGDRVNFLSGNILHMPSFRKEVDSFYALETVEKRARVINNVDPGWLAVYLLVITLALRFYPCTPPQGWVPIAHLFDGRSIHLYASGARTTLVLARYQSSQSLAVLQAILLSNLSDSHAGRKYNQTMLRIALSNAQEMGLHRLGDRNKQPQVGESQSVVVRREVAKRIWYQLVFKDWSGSVCTGTYSVQDKQFNTPLPGNYNDDDLEKMPLPSPHPREHHTEMSYSLECIEIVKVMKLHTDIMTERRMDVEALDGKGATKLACADASHLDAAYRNLLDGLPSFFAVGSEDGTDTNIEIQRWLLQQSIFHHLLRLHRPALSSHSNARTSCVALARSILDTQKKLRSRCTVIDRLMCNLAQSYTAAIVLLLDLLQNGQSQSPAMRTVIRSEVAEALRALHHVNETNNSTEAGIRVLEALLSEEDARWNANQEELAHPSGSKRKRGSHNAAPRRKDLLNLALRIARAAKCESECKSQEQQVAKDRLEKEHEGAMMLDGTMGAMADPRQEGSKDALSRALMEQLLVPPSAEQQRRYYPTPQVGDGSNHPRSSDLSGAPAFGALGLPGGSMFDLNTVGPNGVEGGNLLTPPDANGFDLSSFLAQYDSPGSSSSGAHNGTDDARSLSSGASSSGYSTSLTHPGSEELHRQASTSSSESPVNAKQSPIQQQGGSVNGNVPLAASGASNGSYAPQQTSNGTVDHTAFGLDAFYNWVLSQGLNGRGPGTPAAGAGTGAQNRQPQPTSSSSSQQQSQMQQQGQTQMGPPSSSGSYNQPMSMSHADNNSNTSMNLDATSGGNGNQGTAASELTQPTSVASGYSAIEPYFYLAPFGGPPQNGWPSQSGNNNNGTESNSDKNKQPTASTTSGSGASANAGGSYMDMVSSGLTPLPSSLNMGTPSADGGAGPTAGGGAGVAGSNNLMAGWLNSPGLIDW